MIEATFLCTLIFSVMCLVTVQQPVLYNAALFKPSFQSSTISMYVATRGNDGNRSNYVHHTNNTSPAWWMVDLRGTFVIEQIVLTNRADQYSTRLKNFQIEVFKTDPRDSPMFPNVTGQLCLNMSSAVSNGTFTWNCTSPLVGRYVWTIMRYMQFLHVAEYEVMVSDVINILLPSYRSTTDHKIINIPALRNLTAIRSSLQCAAECFSIRETEACTSFNWFSSTKECQLFKLDARNQLFGSRLMFYPGSECFTEIF